MQHDFMHRRSSIYVWRRTGAEVAASDPDPDIPLPDSLPDPDEPGPDLFPQIDPDGPEPVF
jgi:hypothetical protein